MGISIPIYLVMLPPTLRCDGAKTLEYVCLNVGIPAFLDLDCRCCSQRIKGAQFLPSAMLENDLPNPPRYIHQFFT